MANPSTARRRFGAALSALGIGVAATAALVGMAGTAGAHVPEIKAECTENGTVLQVNLKKYDTSGENTVKVMDGDEVLLDTTQFGESFEQTFDGLDATVDHAFTADVKAHDDPDGSKGFTKVLTAEAKSCVTPPPSSETPPPSSSEAPPPSSEAPPVPTTTSPAPQAAPPPLAETGASIALPIGIGALLLVGGGVMLFVVRRRSRA